MILVLWTIACISICANSFFHPPYVPVSQQNICSYVYGSCAHRPAECLNALIVRVERALGAGWGFWQLVGVWYIFSEEGLPSTTRRRLNKHSDRDTHLAREVWEREVFWACFPVKILNILNQDKVTGEVRLQKILWLAYNLHFHYITHQGKLFFYLSKKELNATMVNRAFKILSKNKHVL